MSRIDDVKELIIKHQRRLQLLKEKQALKGLDVGVDVILEIEDIELQLANLQTELKQLAGAEDEDNLTSHPVPRSQPLVDPHPQPAWKKVAPWLAAGGGLLIIGIVLAAVVLGTLSYVESEPDPDESKSVTASVTPSGRDEDAVTVSDSRVIESQDSESHLTTEPASPQANVELIDGPPIALIIDYRDVVEIKPADDRRLVKPDFGKNLFTGDVVIALAGGWVDILCIKNRASLHLAEGENRQIECGQDVAEPQINDETLNVSQLASAANTLPEIDRTTQRGARDDENAIPRLLSPRNTAITNSRPTFSWQPVDGAGGYRLELNMFSGDLWSRETTDTHLTYPEDEPPLPFDSVGNSVTLMTLDDETGKNADKSLLSLPSEADLAEIAAAEADIKALDLNESGRGFLLVQLYRQRNLLDAAITQLEQLVEDTPSPALYLQLGDLYLEVGLNVLAEERYTQALTAAKTSGDFSAQAAAYVGLARIAAGFDELPQAADHLTTAEALYRQAGEIDLADAVVAERDKLEQGSSEK